MNEIITTFAVSIANFKSPVKRVNILGIHYQVFVARDLID